MCVCVCVCVCVKRKAGGAANKGDRPVFFSRFEISAHNHPRMHSRLSLPLSLSLIIVPASFAAVNGFAAILSLADGRTRAHGELSKPTHKSRSGKNCPFKSIMRLLVAAGVHLHLLIYIDILCISFRRYVG